MLRTAPIRNLNGDEKLFMIRRTKTEAPPAFTAQRLRFDFNQTNSICQVGAVTLRNPIQA